MQKRFVFLLQILMKIIENIAELKKVCHYQKYWRDKTQYWAMGSTNTGIQGYPLLP